MNEQLGILYLFVKRGYLLYIQSTFSILALILPRRY